MNLIGAPDEWIDLIDDMVPDILDLVIATWEAMPPPANDAREDPTTEELCLRLRQNRNSSELPFRIDIQMVELDPEGGEDQGRMDIAFSPPVPREDIYFCLECKRLNVTQKNGKIRSYASEYIVHGMMRFVRGQYAKSVRHGGMLGYVLDGDIIKAMKNVASNIKKRFEDLEMESPGEMQLSSVRPKQSNLKETHHKRKHSPDIFQIHHFFAAA
jgi:hypothetical protein